MAKNKKKRATDGRLKVITGGAGGAVRAVLPGKGPAWKQEQQARQSARNAAPSTGAHAASQPRSGPPNRRRDDDAPSPTDDDELSTTKPIPAPFPRAIVFGGLAVVVLLVAYFLLRNPPRGETPAPAPTPTAVASATGSTLPFPPPASNAAPNGVSAPPVEPSPSSSAPVPGSASAQAPALEKPDALP